MRQVLYVVACRHRDGDNVARPAADPIQKPLIGRDPVSGTALASQPTHCRGSRIRCGAQLAPTQKRGLDEMKQRIEQTGELRPRALVL